MTRPYIAPGDVSSIPGRLTSLWNAMTASAQLAKILEASARVDEIIGQTENLALGRQAGLFPQTSVSYSQLVDRTLDTLMLPNKPITNVRSIAIEPEFGAPYNLPVVLTTPGRTIILSGGQSLVCRLNNVALPVDVPNRGPLPFRDGDYVTVVYDCGTNPIPVAVQDATRKILMAYLFAEADNPGGAESIGERGAHVQFGTHGNMMLTEAEGLLSPWTLQVLL